jgi:hypothetical protein
MYILGFFLSIAAVVGVTFKAIGLMDHLKEN